MNGFWYRVVVWTSRIFGSWFFALVARIIAAGYFLFSRNMPESRRFYAALYPERSKIYHLWCTFQQYQHFTTIHFDRLLLNGSRPVDFTSQGWENLEAVIGKQGGILLMSHLGNWEMAATLLKRQKEDLRLLLYMGVKEKEGVERIQKEDLRRSGVTIIGVDQGENAAFSAVEGIRFLQSGGLVSLAGDRLWRHDQRRLRVTFLGHDAYIPEAPFIFALVSGSPLFAFFTFRTGKSSTFTLSDPITVQAQSRQDRAAAINRAAQQYADLLEQALRQHPFEWYHFERFIY
ncbi:MAG: lysophospholipid acyltransferase family protein [Candidatus Electrothrix communis]|nr:lysophospholipid acyltransferase family protein [Desulfobulbus sp. US4]WLE96340.1 MAG: lysophospholipid acyltransferase family protein [Candidatus Electrothrix communis]